MNQFKTNIKNIIKFELKKLQKFGFGDKFITNHYFYIF